MDLTEKERLARVSIHYSLLDKNINYMLYEFNSKLYLDKATNFAIIFLFFDTFYMLFYRN